MSNGTTAERRREPREPRTEKVRLEWTDSGLNSHWVLGQCLDLSAKGMRVEINDLIPENQYVRFEIVRKNYRGTATVRNRTVKGRRSQLGLEFAWSAKWEGGPQDAARLLTNRT